jgi:cytochrome c-type biogenesis protein CcmH
MRIAIYIVVLFCTHVAGPLFAPTIVSSAFAVEPGERLADPVQESRARAISAELRCLVCQNQSIDDSNAPLARDLRMLVRERISAGDSNDGIMRFVVDRYGEFVLLRPRFGWHTALLWLAPAGLIAAIVFALFAQARLRQTRPAANDTTRPLTADEQQRLDRILAPEPDGKS